MSRPRQRQFEIRTGAKSPFLPREPRSANLQKGRKKGSRKGSKNKSKDREKKKNAKGPSGSDWNELHLNWLHILLEFDHDLKDIFSHDSQLSQSSKIASSLRAKLKEDWGWVCRTDHEESNSIYGCLKDLVHQREKEDVYNTHSNTQSSTKHLTPRSAKSDSVTPQQGLGATQDSRGDFERTPTPLSRHQGTLNPQTYTPQLLSRKRQLEEVLSPQRGRRGIENTLKYSESTPPPYRYREGSPTPRQPPEKPKAGQLKCPATPSRSMLPPSSPLTHRQQNLAIAGLETQSHPEPDRSKPLFNRQSSVAWQQHLETPSREEKFRRTHGGQKNPLQLQSQNQGFDASSTIQSQLPGLQSMTDDDEDGSDEGEDGEEEDGEREDDEEEDDDDDSDEDDSGFEEDGGGIPEAAAFDKSEEDVKATGRVFLSLVRDVLNNTKQGVERKKVAEQNLVFETRDPRPHEIMIDETPMSTHPDLVLEMTFGEHGQRKSIGIVLEFKRRNHHLNEQQLLAQEVSELLGTVLGKMASFSHRKKYKSYLVSWHGLKGYISRFDASREYLQQLQMDSRVLQDLDPPTVRRSKEFDLTVAEERIAFAIVSARIAVEELQEYERNRTSGLLDRILA